MIASDMLLFACILFLLLFTAVYIACYPSILIQIKSFLSLKILWLVVGVLVVISCIISGVISYNSKLYWDFSADGFNCFISLFRFPLGISALIIPIVALLAANHRSEQTKKQIELANTQNVFQNYYKHVEEFTKYVNSIESKLFFSVRKLHKYLYPYSKDGRYFFKNCCY